MNQIAEAISMALYTEFGEDYHIYVESVMQGLSEPCFFISCIHSEGGIFRGNRHARKNQFCIQYFPRDELRANGECTSVADRLFLCLKRLHVNEIWIMGRKMNCEVSDGLLHFFVHYDVFLDEVSERIPAMEDLKRESNVKG